MAYSVSSWFIEQMQSRTAQPTRKLTINGSDYSERVNRWPTIKFNADGIQSVRTTVPLANNDGALNTFYQNAYTMPGTMTFDFGFTHPQSGDELVRLFTGDIKQVKYSKDVCNLYLRDRMWRFTDIKVGESKAPVIFSSQIPSDIAWTLCTCYGGLSDVQSTSNPDIDWEEYNVWAEQFSSDNVIVAARYDGKKLTRALKSLADMTDSVIWADGFGRITFRRYSEASSLDFVITRNEQLDLIIDVDDLAVINTQYVNMDYSPESKYWAKSVLAVASTSINSFGMRENVLADETVWYVDSYSAITMANRRVSLLKYPPKRFDVQTVLPGLNLTLGETVRLVDSFYGITSGSGWRFTALEINMEEATTRYGVDEATVMNGFYLDESNLDGDNYLL